MRKFLITAIYESDLEGEDWGDIIFEAEDETSALIEVERLKNIVGIISCTLKGEME
tara:strand:+ start:29 stop:196 length:168 start_codon:yes stop_codon:yes gene_type:complete